MRTYSTVCLYNSTPTHGGVVSVLKFLLSLGGMLSLTQKGLEQCPVFFLQLPAGRGIDGGDDILVRRAVTSALASLNDTDPDIVLNSILVLTGMVSALILV
jgi:hypothetical protein